MMEKRYGLLVFSLALLSGCGCQTKGMVNTTHDPLQPYNRGAYRFNSDFTNAFMKPVTKVYEKAPQSVRTGIHNFFVNLKTLPDIANDLLQFNFHYMIKDITRLAVNTTLGLGGFIDMAAKNGIYAHDQSFDYTLAKWGCAQSPYFVVPLLGPSTVTGALSEIPDYFANPIAYVEPNWLSYSLTGLNVVDVAAENIPKQKALLAMSFDPYVSLRDAYLQNRQYDLRLIENDGHLPPMDNTEEA